jgi:hypothetical protein
MYRTWCHLLRKCCVSWKVRSFGINCRVVRWKSIDVTGKHVASVLRVEEQSKQEASMSCLLHASFLLGLFLILEEGAKVSCETAFHFHQTTRNYIPEDRTLYNYRCVHLKCCHISWLVTSRFFRMSQFQPKFTPADPVCTWRGEVKIRLNILIPYTTRSPIYPPQGSAEV